MPTRFDTSHLKVKRAYKHIDDLNSMLVGFINSDFYDLGIERDFERRRNYLSYSLRSGLDATAYALVIGDALHNLRSALDLLYYEAVIQCGGFPSKYTRFPIRDTREELITTLDAALKEKKITEVIRALLLNVVKPYKTDNFPLWALDDLNISDKHQLLVPVLKLVRITGVRFEDDHQRPLMNLRSAFFFEEPASIRLNDADEINITVKDKGHATAQILFDADVPYGVEPIIPTLTTIAQNVTDTIGMFDLGFTEAWVFRSLK